MLTQKHKSRLEGTEKNKQQAQQHDQIGKNSIKHRCQGNLEIDATRCRFAKIASVFLFSSISCELYCALQLLPSFSAAMLISPAAIVMTSPPPVPAYRSDLIPVPPVPSFDPYDLLPANLGRPMMRPVSIVVIIAIVVGKDDRWKRGERRKKSFDPTPLRLAL